MLETEWFNGRGVDEERAHVEPPDLLRYVVAIVACGVALGLLGLAGCAGATPAVDLPVYVLDKPEGGLIANLYAGPCKDPRIVEFFQVNKPKFTDRLREARTKFRMMSGQWRDYAGCWLELTKEEAGRELIYLHLEDGDKYLLPKDDFKTRGAGV